MGVLAKINSFQMKEETYVYFPYTKQNVIEIDQASFKGVRRRS